MTSFPSIRIFALALAAHAALATFAGSVRAAGPTAAAPASGVRLRRFALLVGVNDGGGSRTRLRYAVSDARAMSRVLQSLGGVAPGDLVFVADADRAGLVAAFDRMGALLRAAATPGVRRELLVYYSGHSDEEGLLMHGDRLAYDELRARLQGVAADVRVAILDSCASGAFTRRKGGVWRPPFLMDASVDMRGHAILTSSSANEVAQESDRVGGSFFTHFLVSGLRGAADVNSDRRVTLQEAFQFASQETLARTERTRGGPQHAAYEFDLAGTGELVVTDVRSTQAALVLAADLAGRVSVRDAAGDLVAELRKNAGHPVELGLEPGPYVVTMDGATTLFEARATLAAGERAQLSRLAFRAVGPLEVAQARGDAPPAARADLAATAAEVAPTRVGTHAAMAGLDPQNIEVDGIAFGLVGERVAIVHGVELAFGIAQTDREMRGLQLALGAAVARGQMKGVQAGGLVNFADGRFRGVQLGEVVSVTRGDARGLQLSGATNVALGTFAGAQIAAVNVAEGEGMMTGTQIGAANWARRARGLQLGAINMGGEVRGVRIAAINVARAVNGVEVGAVNVGGEASGFQLSAINVYRRARGFTFGVVNVAENHDGEAFGLLNFIGNGIHDLTLYTSDAMAANIELKLGTRHLYTSLAAAFHPGDELVAGGPERFSRGNRRFGFGLGLGWRFFLERGRFEALELEAACLNVVKEMFDAPENPPILSSLRLQGTFRLAPHLALVGGPAVNVAVGWGNRDADIGTGFLERIDRSGGTTVRIYPGFVLGVQI